MKHTWSHLFFFKVNIMWSSLFGGSSTSDMEYFLIFPYQILLNTPHHSCNPTKQTWSHLFLFKVNIMWHWCAEKTLVLLEIESLVPRVVILVSMVNCWCADQETFFFKENIMWHWCAEKTLVLLKIKRLVSREVTLVSIGQLLVRGSGYIFFSPGIILNYIIWHKGTEIVIMCWEKVKNKIKDYFCLIPFRSGAPL